MINLDPSSTTTPNRGFQSLVGQSVLITGAGAGVGRGMAHAFASVGARVVIAELRPENGERTAAEIKERGGEAASVACDVTKRGDVEGAIAFAVDRFGGLDSLIHNAVSPITTHPHDLETLTTADWEDHANVSVRGAFYCAQAAYPHLRASKGNLIVVVSVIGIEGDGNRPLYAAVKGAQRGFVKSLAREWAPEGIRVNAMGPLAYSPTMEASFIVAPELLERVYRTMPLGRFGDAENDIAPAVLFLCSDAARFVVGQTIFATGGRFTAH
jgi:3-oxoacyl-[acyl-carrier protein] reductase